MPSISSKMQLRSWAKAQIKGFSEDYLLSSNQKITSNLLKIPLVQQAQTIFCYVSVGREVDTRAFLQQQLDAGKTICVPKTKKNGQMDARHIRSLRELMPAPFGLQEPSAETPPISPSQIDVVIVPCLLCDEQGTRLGYGGGYYDRYLAQLSCPAICLCRQPLLVAQLPKDSFDIPMQYAVTDISVLSF